MPKIMAQWCPQAPWEARKRGLTQTVCYIITENDFLSLFHGVRLCRPCANLTSANADTFQHNYFKNNMSASHE